MNLVDYVLENKNKSFVKMPFNEVDALVFAQLSYYNFSLLQEDIYIKQLRKIEDLSCFTSMRNLTKLDIKLLKAVVNSKRFEDVYISNYVSDFDIEYEKQFAAVTFMLNSSEIVVTFRGTDGTIVGWKENFNMTYMTNIPSQVHAALYLNEAIRKKSIKKAYVVGHSKGGNLAVYAASKVKEERLEKIDTIYNFDGPGFKDMFYKTKGYKNVKDKILKLIPPQSCVGRIMYDDTYQVIESEDQSIYQHWVFNWVVENNQIKRVSTTEFISDNIDLTLDDILEELSILERKKIVDMFYKIFRQNELIYVDDVLTNKNEIFKFIKNYFKEEKSERIHITNFFMRLLVIFMKNYFIEKTAAIKRYAKQENFPSKEHLKNTVKKVKNKIKEKYFD